MATSRKVIVIFNIVAIVAIGALVLNIGMVSATDIFVGPSETYTSIQSAVNVSNPFDTIIVRDGTYNENIDVTVDNVTILSENGSANCVVNALDQNDHVFEVTADYVNIRGFTVQDAVAGIYLDNVDHCTISENIAVDNGYGIWLSSSSTNNLTGNTANSNAHGGIYLFSSSSNNLTNNIMVWEGIIIEGNQLQHWNTYSMDTSNTVNGKPVYYWKDQVGGTVPSGAGQVILANCTNVVVENQIVSDGSAGICLGFSSNNTIANNTVSNNSYGILLLSSSNNNTLTGNTANSNSEWGIWLNFVYNNTLTGNTASNNSVNGIWLSSSSKNKLTKNTVSNNSVNGICLSSSSNNTLTGNTASNNSHGIYLSSSSSNNLTNNIMVWDGIIIEGNQLQHWNTYSMDTSNTVNGKPVYYWKDQVGGTVPSGAGQVILANCTNVVVENQIVSDGSAGICLGFSSNNTIANNTVSNNLSGTWKTTDLQLDKLSGDVEGETSSTLAMSPTFTPGPMPTLGNGGNGGGGGGGGGPRSVGAPRFGIYLSSSSTNKIANNTASNNSDYGIWLEFSSNNTLTSNTANSNSYDGISLYSSSNNFLTGNTASDNYNGISLYSSSNNNTLTGNTANSNVYCGILLSSSNNNLICNNYFNNTQNTYDSGNNVWNLTKTEGRNIIGGSLLGGNYWSDYDGNDTNGDGLGDTPYDIPGGANKDYLPLVAITAPEIFDTSKGEYPSIAGTHNGTIKLNHTITVSKLYTYPCSGTGGHTEYVKISNSTNWNVTATWNGYTGDWHNLTFNNSFTLFANETYNYTIITGSYPQIIHAPSHNATGGVITCMEFVDINGKRYEGWIPAIRLS